MAFARKTEETIKAQKSSNSSRAELEEAKKKL
jgi:hypothetical protein